MQDTVKTNSSKNNQTIRIAIVTSSYHQKLTKNMESSCVAELKSLGVQEKNIDLFEAPGSWEIPLIVQNVAKGDYQGIVALGVIIKGETYHFEMIANQVALSLMKISLEKNIPIALEVLATMNLEQAQDRAFGDENKGVEAARTLVTAINSLASIESIHNQ